MTEEEEKGKEKKKGKQKREPVYKDELPNLIPKLIEDFFAQKEAEREKWEEEMIAKGQLVRPVYDVKDEKEAGGRKYDFG